MKRRDFLANSALAAATLAARSAFAAPGQTTVTVRANRPLGTIAPDFTGVGYEISSVSRPGLLSASNKVYVQLVRTLGTQGVIRIGGNTADYANYSPNAAAVSSPKATVINDAVLKDLGGFLKATGWKLIWALDLGRGTEADAIAESKIIQSIAGERLLAFEIGNEPDLFARARHRNPEYRYEDWLAEYRRYKAALRKEFPRIPFAGPDAAVKTDWVTRFAADEGKDSVLLAHHYYREGQNPTSSIEKLLGVDPKLQPQLTALKAASQACGVPYRICEVNSFSGGGRPGVSDTMAGALWVLDYMFTLAANGCAGVNMETGVNQLDFISSYSPIGDDEHGHYSAKPEYYGMLAFSLAAQGRLLTTEVDAGSPEVRAYATQSSKRGLALALINKGATTSALTVNLGEHVRAKQASVIRLSAPTVDAKTAITLGGAEVTPEGTWKGAKTESTHVQKGQLAITLLPFSAAIVQIV
ncbi:MAG: glycosyl hydrolase family 79 C-terminal domain-containing protein [Acidobacteriota bacterium]